MDGASVLAQHLRPLRGSRHEPIEICCPHSVSRGSFPQCRRFYARRSSHVPAIFVMSTAEPRTCSERVYKLVTPHPSLWLGRHTRRTPVIVRAKRATRGRSRAEQRGVAHEQKRSGPTGCSVDESERLFDATELRPGGVLADDVAVVVGDEPGADERAAVVDRSEVGVHVEHVLDGL